MRPWWGITVNVTFDVDCDGCWCGPGLPDTTLFTDVGGDISLYVRVGLDRGAATECCVATTTVTCLSVTLHLDTMEWLSPDLEAVEACYVGGLDFALFSAEDYSMIPQPKPWHCRSDFNCDDEVVGLDYSIWVLHYLHDCF